MSALSEKLQKSRHVSNGKLGNCQSSQIFFGNIWASSLPDFVFVFATLISSVLPRWTSPARENRRGLGLGLSLDGTRHSQCKILAMYGCDETFQMQDNGYIGTRHFPCKILAILGREISHVRYWLSLAARDSRSKQRGIQDTTQKHFFFMKNLKYTQF